MELLTAVKKVDRLFAYAKKVLFIALLLEVKSTNPCGPFEFFTNVMQLINVWNPLDTVAADEN